MISGYKVRFDPIALDALNEATDYIKEESGHGHAGKWVRRMLAGIEKLETLPGAFSVETRPSLAAVNPGPQDAAAAEPYAKAMCAGSGWVKPAESDQPDS